MARNALNSPGHRVLQRSAPGQGGMGNAPDAAPSLDYGASGIQDPRLPWNTANSSTGAQILGWSGGDVCTLDATPHAVVTGSIAAGANVVSGTAMTLISATGNGVTVLAASFLALPSLNTIPVGALALEGNPGYVRFGIRDFTGFFDPTLALARGVSVTSVSGSAGGTFTIAGYDYYGYPQTDTVTSAGGVATVTSLKTFKWVTTVTPNFTDAHAYSVQMADLYGIGLASDSFAYVRLFRNGVLAVLSTYTKADSTSPATALTGDVRGTYTPATGVSGSEALQFFVKPSLSRLAQTPMSTGLFGVPTA